MTEAVILFGGVLVIAWGIALVVGVWKIHSALLDKEYPILTIQEGGTEYRVQVRRVKGRFGATYQHKGGEPQQLEPTFNSSALVIGAVRAILVQQGH